MGTCGPGAEELPSPVVTCGPGAEELPSPVPSEGRSGGACDALTLARVQGSL